MAVDGAWLVVPTRVARTAPALDRLLVRVAKVTTGAVALARISLDEGRAWYIRLHCYDLVQFATLASLAGAEAALLRLAGDHGGATLFHDGARGRSVRGTARDAAALTAEAISATADEVLAAVAAHAASSRPLAARWDQAGPPHADNPNIVWSLCFDDELEVDLAVVALEPHGAALEQRFWAWQKKLEKYRVLTDREDDIQEFIEHRAEVRAEGAHLDVLAIVRGATAWAHDAVAKRALVRVLVERGVDPDRVEDFVQWQSREPAE